MPNGRRASSPCTTTSRSQEILGPGGAEVECCKPRNSFRVAAGSGPRCLPTPPSVNLSKLNPALAIPTKNLAGLVDAVDDMCATMSRTDHWVHRDRVSH